MNYGRYSVKKELGRGMNVVYLAYDSQMDSQEATRLYMKVFFKVSSKRRR